MNNDGDAIERRSDNAHADKRPVVAVKLTVYVISSHDERLLHRARLSGVGWGEGELDLMQRQSAE